MPSLARTEACRRIIVCKAMKEILVVKCRLMAYGMRVWSGQHRKDEIKKAYTGEESHEWETQEREYSEAVDDMRNSRCARRHHVLSADL